MMNDFDIFLLASGLTKIRKYHVDEVHSFF